jgi:hypothetical protein
MHDQILSHGRDSDVLTVASVEPSLHACSKMKSIGKGGREPPSYTLEARQDMTGSHRR